MRCRLEVVGGDGQLETLIPPLPCSYFVENWDAVCQAVGPYATIRLVFDSGHVLSPLKEGNGLLQRWKVQPGDIVVPDLKSALRSIDDVTQSASSAGS